MKTKKFKKKLSLNKTTIATLGNGQMSEVQGGDTGYSECVCADTKPNTCPPQTCLTCTCLNCNTSAPYVCLVTECDCSDTQPICEYTCGC
jgi:hypothetical protein